MPLSRGATLTWLGFSDEGLLAAHDSAVRPAPVVLASDTEVWQACSLRRHLQCWKNSMVHGIFGQAPAGWPSAWLFNPLIKRVKQGVLRWRTPEMGGAWVPVFASSEHQKQGESYWPVGVSVTHLCCIVCPAGEGPCLPIGSCWRF